MKARKILFPLISLLGLLLAQAPGLAQAQPATPAATRHCLWQVQGRSNTVHLLGSIHFLKKEFYPLAPPIEDAYKQAQVVVFEADLDQLQSPQIQMQLMAKGRYPGGETLQQHLSKETYARLQSYLAERLGPGAGAAFDQFRPWMVAVTLMALELQKLGFDPEQGVDQYFQAKAKRDHKTIVGLETVEFQLSLFTGLSQEEGEQMLKETLDEISTFKKIMAEITEAWKTGDTAKIDTLIMDAMRGYPEVYKKLVVDRNRQWTDKIEKLLAEGKPVFVVVGAGHLVGKDSVVSMLGKKGLEVRQR